MPRKKKTQPAAEPTQPETTAPPPAQDAGRPQPPAGAAPPQEGGADETRSHAAAHRPTGPEVPNPFESKRDGVAGVRLLEDRRFKQMQIRFDEKPSEAVRAAMDEAGFTWRQKDKAWTRQLDPDAAWKTRADAERLYAKVAGMIREEKGVTTELA